MDSKFSDLGISSPILQALDGMGFETPTPVQERAIPHILNGKDLIVMSKTGSGKTAVFGISMLQLTDHTAPGPQGLILTPTRELAVQVDSDIKKMAAHLEHRTAVVYGQHSMNVEIQALKKGATIVAGTPGRVFDHIRHKNLDTRNIRFLVLDEADRMLDMGFIDQVERIIKALPKERITLLFSATIPPEIQRMCRDYMKHPEIIEIESPTKTVDIIEQLYYRVEKNEKRTQLNRLLLLEQPESCMIFCNTRIAVDQVQSFLTRKGYASEALHGDIPQGKRIKTIDQFKQGEFHILVATDVAARGIHIEELSLVINYDVPIEKDSYVHRIGRTGRAGKTGRAVTMVTADDIMSLYAIEEHIGAMIPEEDLPTDAALNERKEDAKKWVEANALKEKPAQESSKSASRGPSKKPSYSKTQQHHDNRKDQPGEPSRSRTTESGKVRSGEAGKVRPAEPGRTRSAETGKGKPAAPGKSRSVETAQDQKPVRRSNPQRPADHPKGPSSAARPRPPYPPRNNSVPAKPNTETVQVKEAPEKKSFLKKIVQRLLGK